MPERLLPCSTRTLWDELLWTGAPGTFEELSTTHFGFISLSFGVTEVQRMPSSLHCILYSHLDNNNTYAGMLFDFSSAFNTVRPAMLISQTHRSSHQHLPLSLDQGLSNQQTLSMLSQATPTPPVTLNRGVPQGCVLSPFLPSLPTTAGLCTSHQQQWWNRLKRGSTAPGYLVCWKHFAA